MSRLSQRLFEQSPLQWFLRDKYTGRLQATLPHKAEDYQQKAGVVAKVLDCFCQAYLEQYPHEHRKKHGHSRAREVALLKGAVSRVGRTSISNIGPLRHLQMIMYVFVRRRLDWYTNKQCLERSSMGVVFNFVEALLSISTNRTMFNLNGDRVWSSFIQCVMKARQERSMAPGALVSLAGTRYDTLYVDNLDREVGGLSPVEVRRLLKRVEKLTDLTLVLAQLAESGRFKQSEQIELITFEMPN